MRAEVLSWLDETARRGATAVTELPNGFVVRNADYPHAHSHNRVVITGSVNGPELVRVVNGSLSDASHRSVQVRRPRVAEAVTPDLIAAGYERDDELIMLSGAAGAAGPARPVEIIELGLDERIAVATAEWRADQNEEVARQLGERVRTVLGAAEVTFLGVRSPDGDVLAHVDLYVRDGIAQIEELLTAEPARGQGLASALVVEAVRRAEPAQAFLVADAEDWPQHLYGRLGFTELVRVASFSRT